MNWLLTYIAILIIIEKMIHKKRIYLTLIWIQIKIIIITLCINETYNNILTTKEVIIYKIANILSQTTIEIWITSIIIIILIIKKEKKSAQNTNKIIKEIKKILYITIIISYIQHIQNITNTINIMTEYQLYNNYIVAIHPPMLIIALTLFYIINEKKKKENNSIIISYKILSSAIVLGGIWASSIFGWGGFWIWDPIENIIIIYLYILTTWIHKKETEIKSSNMYIIWYIIFTKTNIINGLHSFNEINEINALENMWIWSNTYIIILMLIWFYKKKYVKKKKNIWTWSKAIPITLIITNNINEQLHIKNILYIPTNMTTILIAYTIIIYYIKKTHTSTNQLWIKKNELILTLILYIKIQTIWIKKKISLLMLWIIKAITTNLIIKKKKKYNYIKDHIEAFIILLILIIYINTYTENEIENKKEIIVLNKNNEYIIITNKEKINNIQEKIELSNIINEKKKSYIISKIEKKTNNWTTNIETINKKKIWHIIEKANIIKKIEQIYNMKIWNSVYNIFIMIIILIIWKKKEKKIKKKNIYI